jgi:tropomyosin-1
MDAIKKKMMSLASETNVANAKAKRFEDEAIEAGKLADKTEEQVRTLQKKLQSFEGQFDHCFENLFNASVKLEGSEKVLVNAETDVGNLSRRIVLMEEEVRKSENRLAKSVKGLCVESKRADDTVRSRQKLEQAQTINEEQIDTVEGQLKEAKFMLADSERKYEDIARKLGRIETDLVRSTERAETGENKIIDLEEELKVVGNNLQQLEVSEEKAYQREEGYQKQIHDLILRLKTTETRAENSEMNIQRLNIRIDQVEDDLLTEKLKIKAVSDDLDGTFRDMNYI